MWRNPLDELYIRWEDFYGSVRPGIATLFINGCQILQTIYGSCQCCVYLYRYTYPHRSTVIGAIYIRRCGHKCASDAANRKSHSRKTSTIVGRNAWSLILLATVVLYELRTWLPFRKWCTLQYTLLAKGESCLWILAVLNKAIASSSVEIPYGY